MGLDGARLTNLRKLIEDGIVKTMIDTTYPMGETVNAYKALKDGHAVGKIVVAIAQ